MYQNTYPTLPDRSSPGLCPTHELYGYYRICIHRTLIHLPLQVPFIEQLNSSIFQHNQKTSARPRGVVASQTMMAPVRA